MNLYVVRAENGKYTDHFIRGGYAAIGWFHEDDLSKIKSREELLPMYKRLYPTDTSNVVIGQQVGQIGRFLLEIQPGDFIITPAADTDYIYYGIVSEGESYYFEKTDDGCPNRQRRKVSWVKTPVLRSMFNVPFQNSIRSSLSVFQVPHLNNFLQTIGKPELLPPSQQHEQFDYYTFVLNRILELDDKEFEILITYLLTALGFEGSEHVGKVGDGGVDATGELNVSNLAKVKIFVQAKRYKLGTKISANTVKALRQSIPSGAQGAFITTCDYQAAAKEIALEAGFARIGLINGKQLVDLLVEHWEDIPTEFKDKLNLKIGLVVS